jgi:hypothetical protein
MLGPTVSCWKNETKLSAPRFLAGSFQRTLAQQVQLELAHGPFQSMVQDGMAY